MRRAAQSPDQHANSALAACAKHARCCVAICAAPAHREAPCSRLVSPPTGPDHSAQNPRRWLFGLGGDGASGERGGRQGFRDGRPRHGLAEGVGEVRQAYDLGQRAAPLQANEAAGNCGGHGCTCCGPVKACSGCGCGCWRVTQHASKAGARALAAVHAAEPPHGRLGPSAHAAHVSPGRDAAGERRAAPRRVRERAQGRHAHGGKGKAKGTGKAKAKAEVLDVASTVWGHWLLFFTVFCVLRPHDMPTPQHYSSLIGWCQCTDTVSASEHGSPRARDGPKIGRA